MYISRLYKFFYFIRLYKLLIFLSNSIPLSFLFALLVFLQFSLQYHNENG